MKAFNSENMMLYGAAALVFSMVVQDGALDRYASGATFIGLILMGFGVVRSTLMAPHK